MSCSGPANLGVELLHRGQQHSVADAVRQVVEFTQLVSHGVHVAQEGGEGCRAGEGEMGGQRRGWGVSGGGRRPAAGGLPTSCPAVPVLQ